MISKVITRKYARALLQTALEDSDKTLNKVQKDLEEFMKLLEKAPKAKDALVGEQLDLKAKKELLEMLLKDTKIHDYVHNFLRILIDKGRMLYLDDIVVEFSNMCMEHEGLAVATVYSPIKMNKQQRDTIVEKLQLATGKTIVLDDHRSAELIGGFKVILGDMVWDFSIKSNLERLKEQLETSQI